MKSMFYYETVVGKVAIAENGTAITELHLNAGEDISESADIIETPLLKKANHELQEYLSGKRKEFDLPLAPQGTEFQQKVWEELCKIPYGRTCSYKDIAENIGNKKAYRAVGMANNKNPIPIFIPCHRVIGADGSLTGYGGGLEIKEKLLEIEKS